VTSFSVDACPSVCVRALRELYSYNEAAKALGAKAKAVLVFPDIKKAAFIVGAQYGFGALRRGPGRSATTEQALPPGSRLGLPDKSFSARSRRNETPNMGFHDGAQASFFLAAAFIVI